MKLPLFEYRRRKAQADMNKAAAQQRVTEYLMQLGYTRRFAEEAAELGQDLRPVGDLTPDEATQANKLLAEVRSYQAEGYKIEKETIIE